MESMGGNYGGTSDMINNGLNANQNQVSFKWYIITILKYNSKN